MSFKFDCELLLLVLNYLRVRDYALFTLVGGSGDIGRDGRVCTSRGRNLWGGSKA